jgi:hypothetical protein
LCILHGNVQRAGGKLQIEGLDGLLPPLAIFGTSRRRAAWTGRRVDAVLEEEDLDAPVFLLGDLVVRRNREVELAAAVRL